MKTTNTRQRTNKRGAAKIFAAFAAALFLVLIFASCDIMPPAASDYALDAETAAVTLNFTMGQARTVFPEKSFDNYEFFFSAGGDDAVKIEPDVPGGFTFTLEAGIEWGITVKAYAGAVSEDNLAASGTASVITEAGVNTPVTVDLIGNTGAAGKGTFAYTVTKPESAVINAVSLQKIDGMGLGVNVLSGTEAQDSSGEIDAGFYLFTISLYDGPRQAGEMKAVHIYNGMTTNHTASFSNDSFFIPAAVSINAITLAAPLAGAQPAGSIIASEQFTGTVAWSTAAGPFNGSVFAVETVYTAAITLTEKPGYTFMGVGENFFTVEGTTSVTSAADSNVVTAVFQPTEAASYSIRLNRGTADGELLTEDSIVTFASATVGYTGTSAINIIITNTGNTATGTLSVTLSGDNPDSFSSYLSPSSIDPGGSRQFSIFYNLGLDVGTHNAIFTVSNDNVPGQSFNVRFTVNGTPPTPITTAAVTVTAPVRGAAPSTEAGGSGNFSIGAVSWAPNHNPFAGSTQYTASVTLTANAGYTFTGITAANATINGNASTISNNTGAAVTLSYQFPATEAAPDTPITTAAITVTAPVKGAIPNTSASGTGNFSIGAVSWDPSHNPFAASTQYTASVILTANAGYTFTGLASAAINSQTAQITNNTGTAVTLSYQFAATEAADPVNGDASIAFYWVNQQAGVLFGTEGPGTNGGFTLSRGAAQYLTITADPDIEADYTNQRWFIGAVQQAASNGQASFTFSSASRPNGTYLVNLVVDSGGESYSRTFTITVTN